jgi:hypothetical protein
LFIFNIFVYKNKNKIKTRRRVQMVYSLAPYFYTIEKGDLNNENKGTPYGKDSCFQQRQVRSSLRKRVYI